jgi:pimeloyl-ACP methyl ester carboxylesterase
VFTIVKTAPTIVAFLFALLIFSGCDIQYRILYHPDGSVPSEASLAAAGIKPWPGGYHNYRGFIGTHDKGSENGTVVVFHGNAGTADDRAYYVRTLGTLGYRVILAEYPLYGGRGGELGEQAFVTDARKTMRLAFERYGGPLFLLGESLGSGVAAAAARDTPVPLEGILLITPWDTLESVARSKFPFLPVKLLLKDTYDSIGNLRSFEGRIAVVGAARDTLIPIAHADNLYASLSATAKRMWTVGQAGHNDWPRYTDMQWWKDVMGFLNE